MPPSFDDLLRRLDCLSEDFRELRDGFRKALLVADLDPEMALTRVRKMLEFVVREVYGRRCRQPPGTQPLDNLLQRLGKDGHLPRRQAAYANAVRELGNVGTHTFGEGVTAADVYQSLSQLTPVLEWYLQVERPDAFVQPALEALTALDPAQGAQEQAEAERLRQEEAARRQAEEERQRREQEEAERRRRQQEELARLRQEGETKLARLVREALERNGGKITAEDNKAASELCRQHQVPAERAKAIAGEVREQWRQEQPRPPQPGDVVTNSLGMKLAWIPPGTFLMGSPPGEKERSDDEAQHRVTLTKGFYLGVHPVTQAEWQAVMGSNPSNFKGDDRPVEQVSWDDCQEFCQKLSQRESKTYRLPTEAEWEYACRAGTTTPFAFGETISTDQANYDGNYTYGKGRKGQYRQQTTPVGTFPPNAWGLCDMHGNVLEWCQDWFGPYPKGEVKDYKGIQSGDARVLRGGSWYSNPGRCRAAGRGRDAPGFRLGYCGFRVCLCLD